jgi:NADH-quinone oxidoreductase subunit C
VTEADLRTRIESFAGATIAAAGATPFTVSVPPDRWLAFAQFLKNELHCHLFSFLSAVDWKDDGLEVVLWVTSVENQADVLAKTRLGAGVNACDSVVSVYRGAEWMERECFDMFGIQFVGHPDLRRMLLGDDWVGHPLLKSYAVDTPYPPYR